MGRSSSAVRAEGVIATHTLTNKVEAKGSAKGSNVLMYSGWKLSDRMLQPMFSPFCMCIMYPRWTPCELSGQSMKNQRNCFCNPPSKWPSRGIFVKTDTHCLRQFIFSRGLGSYIGGREGGQEKGGEGRWGIEKGRVWHHRKLHRKWHLFIKTIKTAIKEVFPWKPTYILVTPLPGLVDRGLSWPVVERACRARKPTITHARHVSLALPYLNCALMPRCSGGISVRFLDILLSVLSYVCTRRYNDIHFIPPHNGTMNAYECFIPGVPQGSKSLWKSSCGVLPLRKSGEGEI